LTPFSAKEGAIGSPNGPIELPIEATTKARLARSMIALKIGVERPVELLRGDPARAVR
jgi:hypothetical protein